MIRKSLKALSSFLAISLLLCIAYSCIHSDHNCINYSEEYNWAFWEETDPNGIDVFFIAPTVFFGDTANFNMDISDSLLKLRFNGAVNMEKGIYASAENFYAPYYRQVSLNCYIERGNDQPTNSERIQEAYQLAYKDVESAFDYYLTQSNRPFILGGFSQGSEMIIRLIKEKLHSEELQKRHIATYAIGWRLLPAEAEEYPHLQNAQSENDLGVVISYNTEAENIQTSLIVPETSLSINPLNWTTDTTYAPSQLNMGACFTNYSGEITMEIPQFTGAYICDQRGTLKVPDIDPADFPPALGVFKEGVYHIYDYMFFYRNLQQNIETRITTYKNQ